MKKVALSECLWAIVGCVFLLLGSGAELSAQDWSIKQLKDSQHPILETTGKQFDFRDEVLGHVVAELETDFVDDQLHLNISAQSARIGGYRSYRHVAGSNRLTARVLRRMVDGVSRIELRDQTGRLVPATLKSTEAKLPERRLNPDGSMNYLAMTQQDFVVQLKVVSESLSQGSYQIDLFLDSRLRLQIKFQVNEKFQAVSFHSALHFVSQPQTSIQQAAKPRKKLDKPADWDQRDFEGKYFLLSKAIKQDEKELPRWVDFLFEQKEYLLLEQIAFTQSDGFDCNKIGSRLAKVSAPNWPRLTYWAAIYGLEHTNVSPGKVIKQNEDLYYSWCVENQIAVHEDVKYAVKDVSQFWSKLEPKKVFAALKPPAEIAKFSGEKAETGKFYMQQFERAILATVNWKGNYPQRDEELLQLLNHPNDELRKQVMLAYTHLDPYLVPFPELFEIADDKSQSDSVREMATLAASYGHSRKVVCEVNTIAAQVDHPGWKPAVSRLGDLGCGYDLKVLRKHKPKSEELQKILQQSVKRIVDREAATLKIWRSTEQANESSHASTRLVDVGKRMARLIEARVEKKASAEPLQQWTVQYFQAIARPAVVRKVFEHVRSQQKGKYANEFNACMQIVLDGLTQ